MATFKSRFHSDREIYCKYVPLNNFNYSVSVSLKNNYVFVETPKAGCSTIKSILKKVEIESPDLDFDDHLDIHDRHFSPLLKPSQIGGLNLYLEKFKPYTFCFVRNPYNRLLSAYLDKIVGERPPKAEILASMGRDKSDLSQIISFDEFVNAVAKQTTYEMNPHWRPQFFQTFQGILNYDLVGKIESFEQDINLVLEKITPGNEYHQSSTKLNVHRAEEAMAQYYTDGLKKIVQKIYAKDFLAFGYPI